MLNYLKLLIILLIAYPTRANNFIVLAHEQSFFQPCDPNDNRGNTKMADLAEMHMQHEYAEDMETLVTNGNITINVDIPVNMPVQLDVEFFEWKRGKWEQTIFSIRRPDFCKVAFDPSEIWYGLSMQIPENDRVCPPKKGTVYHIKNLENRIELSNIIALDLEGQYKAITHFIVGEYSTCLTSIVNIWKN